MHVSNLGALSTALNARDYYALGHAARVSTYMVLLGRRLGWAADRIADVEQATFLHDIGKIAVPDSVLFKPGKLTAREEQELRRHPVTSADILRPLFGEELALAVRHHHERYDGKGYPDGLSGTWIPEIARAMAVVDAYDAMSFSRPHQAGAAVRRVPRRTASLRRPPVRPRHRGRLRRRARRAGRAAARGHGRGRGGRGPHRRRRARAPAHASRRGATANMRRSAGVLREVRDAHPATVFITTQADLRLGRRRRRRRGGRRRPQVAHR